MKFNTNSPYVYKCTHKKTGRIYFGYRSRNTSSPERDIGTSYFTSSTEVKKNFPEYDVLILAQFLTRTDAMEYEREHILANWSNPLLINKACFPAFSVEIIERNRHNMIHNNPMKLEENKKLARERNIGKKHSQETIQKMIISRKGRKYPNRKRINQSGKNNFSAKYYLFISPDGVEHHVHGGFRDFCKEFHLGHNSCINLAKGRIPHYKGWTIILKSGE